MEEKNKKFHLNDEEKIVLLKQILESIQREAKVALELIYDNFDQAKESLRSNFLQKAKKLSPILDDKKSKIIEGVFDGEKMISGEGKSYSVSANYASKSKLAEGDILKLIITEDGTFVYKQIFSQQKIRLKGVLNYNIKTKEYSVLADGKIYKVLNASITYFKGEPGDEITILVPKEKNSIWAAVENIIKK